FPAPASASAWSPSSSTPSRRASTHASDSAVADGFASARSWSRPRNDASAGPVAPRQPSRSTGASSWSTLRAAGSERRTHEGVRAAAAHGGIERTPAYHAEHHDHRRHQREG